MKDESKYSHKHDGDPGEPCKNCGLSSDNPVHTADDPAPDPPPTGDGSPPPQ